MSEAQAVSYFHTVNPYLVVEDPDALSRFLVNALGGSETSRFTRPDGSVMHLEVLVGDSMVMVEGAWEQFPARTYSHFLTVEDVDAFMERAVTAGAELLEPATDQPYGLRQGTLGDSQGNVWWVATVVEELDAATIASRLEVD